MMLSATTSILSWEDVTMSDGQGDARHALPPPVP